MRIIIEIDSSELQPSVKVEGVKAQTLVEKATDAGEPPEFLVDALSEKKEPEPETAQSLGQDAGAGPAWLIEGAEEIFSPQPPVGNGAGEGDSPAT